MLTDEEIKELKVAGFPQFIAYKKEGKVLTHKKVLQEDVLSPSVEQLREACGSEFESLVQNKEGLWEATATKNKEVSITLTGDSEEQALQRLWLRLNTIQ